MELTDEQVLDAYLSGGGIRQAGRLLTMPPATVKHRLLMMASVGIHIPRLDKRGGYGTRLYTPERVEFLNEYIRRKTEGDNLAGQG